MPWYWIIIIAAALVGIIVLALWKQYRKVGPNEVLIISGGGKRTVTDPDGTKKKIGYRMHIGGGTFVLPFIETAEVLSLEVFTVDVKTPEVMTAKGVPVIVKGTSQVRVRSTDYDIRLAAEQFLGEGIEGMRQVALQIIEGHVRSTIGTMTVEEIYRNRKGFADKVEEEAGKDLARMGLTMISFSLAEITDTQGYLEALGRPEVARIKGEAAIAEAEAEKFAAIKASEARKEGDIARLRAETEVAEVTRDYESKRAEYQAAVNEERAKADLSYELERHRMNQLVKAEEADVRLVEKKKAVELEDMEIKRKEKELEATVRRPAEAESYRQEIEAKGRAVAKKLEGSAEADILRAMILAEAEGMKKKAESWSNYNQAAIYQMFIEALPELAKAVSEPLSKVEKIVVVGGSGDSSLGASRVTGEVAKVLAQLPTIVEALGGEDLKNLLTNLSAMRKKVDATQEGEGEKAGEE
jgi:flotillin